MSSLFIKYGIMAAAGGAFDWVSTAAALTTARYNMAGGSIDDYALFAGGKSGSTMYAQIDAYTSSLVHTNPANYPISAWLMGVANVGNYLVFAGGYTTSSAPPAGAGTQTVKAYNSSLVVSTPSILSDDRGYLGSANAGGSYALFAGGSSSQLDKNVVDAYNASLARSTPTALTSKTGYCWGIEAGNCAIFAGTGGYVDAYSSTLVKTQLAALSQIGNSMAAAKVGGYGIFGGKYYAGSRLATVDAYNSSLVKTTIAQLCAGRSDICGVSSDEYAIFAGGNEAEPVGYTNIVEVYNSSLVKSTLTSLSQERSSATGVKLNDKVLIAGGYVDGAANGTVDVYTA